MHPAIIPVAAAITVIGGGIALLRGSNAKKAPPKPATAFKKAVESKGVSLTPGIPSTGVPVPTTKTPSAAVEAALQKAIATSVSTPSGTDAMTGAAMGAMGIVTTNTGPINLRTSPSTTSPVRASIPKGTAVPILGTDGNWYKTIYNGLTGYASKDFVKMDGEPPTPQQVAAAAVISTDSAMEAMQGGALGAMGIVTTQNGPLSLRSAPGGSVVGMIPKGASVSIMGSSSDGKWYQVLYNGVKGYASKSYITPQ
jgi:uncharacterized protein YraI